MHIRSCHTWTAGKETTSCTGVYLQDWRWIGYIFNSNPCNLIPVHWFLWGYLNVFRISHWAEVVIYPRRNVTMVCGVSYHIFGSCIYLQDTKIRFQLQVESHISDWQFSKSQHLARYVSHHNAMAYDRATYKHHTPGGVRGYKKLMPVDWPSGGVDLLNRCRWRCEQLCHHGDGVWKVVCAFCAVSQLMTHQSGSLYLKKCMAT